MPRNFDRNGFAEFLLSILNFGAGLGGRRVLPGPVLTESVDRVSSFGTLWVGSSRLDGP